MSEKAPTVKPFAAKKFPHLTKIRKIPPKQIEEHMKLYYGYINNTNLLRRKIAELVTSGKAGTPEYAEMVRRLGFEYNGMRLHEYYFENLSGEGSIPSAEVKNIISEAFDDYVNWENHFRKMGLLRGVGWVILYKDPISGNLNNHWINLHEDGHPVGFEPILVLDCWEHAWCVYLKPTDRAKYVEDFFLNIDWTVVEKRLLKEPEKTG